MTPEEKNLLKQRISKAEAIEQTVSQLVGCNCAWGLTDAGRALAEGLKIRWPEDSEKRLKDARFMGHHPWRADDVEGQSRQGDRWVSPRLATDIDDDDDPADFWKRT